MVDELGPNSRYLSRRGFLVAGAAGVLASLASCSSGGVAPETDATTGRAVSEEASEGPTADELRARLDLTEDYRDSFDHGEKGPEFQKYIVLHDTEGDSDPESVVSWWDSNGKGIAAHFVVGKDGSIVQCVDIERIAHHAGFGDTGHNELFGVEDESRDDKVGTEPIGDWASDYGMNSYSVGIEMVHVGGEGDYPSEQLLAVDGLIAWLDACFASESAIIDHKAWRTGNSDTSAEFAGYLANYQDHRTHD
jgi:N-acetylmuramoyl-L-alanine amidase